MRISVLIPIYNSEKWLERCLNSIQVQTYTDLEVILYDDGSTDDSYSICKNFSKKDNRFKVVANEHKGIGYARQALLNSATSEAFIYIDADDWIEPNMIELLTTKLLKDNLDICCCSAIIEDGRKISPLTVTHNRYRICDNTEFVKEYLKLTPLHGSLCNKLICTRIINKIKFNLSWDYAEDSSFVWEIAKKAKRVALLDVTLYHYCIHKGSLSEWTFRESQLTFIQMWKNIISDVSKQYPAFNSLSRKSYTFILCSMLFSIAKTNYNNEVIIKSLISELRVLYANLFKFPPTTAKYFLFASITSLSWPLTKSLVSIYSKLKHNN